MISEDYFTGLWWKQLVVRIGWFRMAVKALCFESQERGESVRVCGLSGAQWRLRRKRSLVDSNCSILHGSRRPVCLLDLGSLPLNHAGIIRKGSILWLIQPLINNSVRLRKCNSNSPTWIMLTVLYEIISANIFRLALIRCLCQSFEVLERKLRN